MLRFSSGCIGGGKKGPLGPANSKAIEAAGQRVRTQPGPATAEERSRQKYRSTTTSNTRNRSEIPVCANILLLGGKNIINN